MATTALAISLPTLRFSVCFETLFNSTGTNHGCGCLTEPFESAVFRWEADF